MKIEGVPDGYELVRIGRPSDELVVGCIGDVFVANSKAIYPIVRKIEPPKPIEPPQGYRLLVEGEIVRHDDMFFFDGKYWDDVCPEARQSIGQPWRTHGNVPFARKIEPKVRPMTRAEFLAAWKQRGFCPLIDPNDDIDVIHRVIIDDSSEDENIVYLYDAGWCCLGELAAYKFASDETYLTVEE